MIHMDPDSKHWSRCISDSKLYQVAMPEFLVLPTLVLFFHLFFKDRVTETENTHSKEQSRKEFKKKLEKKLRKRFEPGYDS